MSAPVIGIHPVIPAQRIDVGDTYRFNTTEVQAARNIEVPAAAAGCDRPWCTAGHNDVVFGPVDRACVIDAPNAEYGFMWLSHYGTGDRLSVSMSQSPNEVAPRIEVGKRIGGKSADPWLRLTSHEALTVAMLLDTMAILGDKPLPVGPAPERAPFWLDGPCPGWCLGGHSARDMYDDRVHSSGLTDIPLTLVDAVNGEQSVVRVAMHRHYRSAASVIEVGPNGADVVNLSSGEARALAGHLRDLALLASARPPAPTAPAPVWATSSSTDGQSTVFYTGPIGTVTLSEATARTPVTREVLVERDDDHGIPGQAFVRVNNLEMTPDGARGYAALLLKAADVADADRLAQ